MEFLAAMAMTSEFTKPDLLDSDAECFPPRVVARFNAIFVLIAASPPRCLKNQPIKVAQIKGEVTS